MTLTTETKFNIGDTAYFLDVNHDITKGVVTKIENKIIVHKDWYTEQKSTFILTEYILKIADIQDSARIPEEKLFNNPEDIVAVLNEQIKNRTFDEPFN